MLWQLEVADEEINGFHRISVQVLRKWFGEWTLAGEVHLGFRLHDRVDEAHYCQPLQDEIDLVMVLLSLFFLASCEFKRDIESTVDSCSS